MLAPTDGATMMVPSTPRAPTVTVELAAAVYCKPPICLLPLTVPKKGEFAVPPASLRISLFSQAEASSLLT
ncbi:hypothetical protein D3C84_638170 [compost metagenome]